MANYLHVDNSSVWIEGMHVSAVATGIAPDIWTALENKICDYGWKLDFGRLRNAQNREKKIDTQITADIISDLY